MRDAGAEHRPFAPGASRPPGARRHLRRTQGIFVRRMWTRLLPGARAVSRARRCAAIFAALSGVGAFEITRGNLPRSRALAEECLQLAGQQTSRPPFIMGHLLLGGTLFLGGHFTTARSHLEEAIRLYEEDRSSRKGKQVLYVQDQKATGLCYLGLGPDDHGTPRRGSGRPPEKACDTHACSERCTR